MDTQQLLKLYKESLESVLTSLENKKYSAETFGKRQELQKKIPGQTDCEDTDYEHFVKTSNSVREQLDKYVRKVDDCGLVLKRIWDIRKKHKDKIKLRSITLTYEEETSQYDKYLKFLFAMEKMIESIGKMDDKPKTSPDDATSQVLSHKRKEPEKKQQSADLHKEDSVDEDNKDVVIGDNSNTICQQPTNEMEEEDKEPKNEDVKGDESKRRCQQPTNEKEEEDKEPKNEDVKGDESKRREELYKTKTELDEMTELHNSQKEEENGMINELDKLRNECEQLNVRVKELEGINASLKDENEGPEKLRNECEQLKARVKELEGINASLKDENEGQLRNEYDRLEGKVKKLVEMNTGLEDENERYKVYEKEYNTLTEENYAHQQSIKAYDRYISKLEDQNTDLEQRLKSQGKGTKETERSEQRLQRPQTAPHAGGRQYKEFQNQIATLTAEKESLMQRLSMVAGMKMRDNNPGIADLSDPNRPEKLAEQFREIYDNAWTNLLDYITDNTDATDDIAVQQIVALTQKIFEQCQTEVGKVKHRLLRIIGYPEDTFEKQYTGGKAGHDPIVKMVKDLVQISAERTYERVLQKIKEIREIKQILQIGGESADVFLTKCSKLCLFMCVKDPPVVLDFNFKRGDVFDKDKLSAFTTSGDSVGYLVWPVMYLHENGPVMSKGVAQGRKK